MSLHAPGLPVEIAVSNMDLYPVDLPCRANWGSNLEQLIPFLEETGCLNFEIHPTDAIMQDVADRELRGDTQLIGRLVGSFHQTFNNGSGMLGKAADWCRVARSQPSIASIDTLQTALPEPVPAVLYLANMSGTAGVIGTLASEPGVMTTVRSGSYGVVQPFAEIYRDLDIRSEAELQAAIALRGIIGLCPDTIHARRRAKDGTSPPPISEVWVDQFASGRVFQMHVSADRVDMKKRDPDVAAKSAQEYQAFISRRWQDAQNTEMGDMIVAAIEIGCHPLSLCGQSAAQCFVSSLKYRPALFLYFIVFPSMLALSKILRK
jgi:hypothetical protein